MEPVHIDPSWLVHAKIAFASMCGGIVRLLFRPASSFLQTVWLLFGCITCGYYGTPPVEAWLDLGDNYSGAVGALIGFIGLSLAESTLKAFDNFDIVAFLHKFIKQE